MNILNNTIIIGAGPAGLATAAALKMQGINPVVLDEHQQVGDSWRAHYECLELNSVKSLSQLPFQRMPASYPRYPSRNQIVDYLVNYAHQHDISPRFNQKVETVQYQDGSWQVQTTNDVFHAKYIVIASGFNRTPRTIEFEGLDTFPGKYMHSHDYKTGVSFRDKRVLVIGAGNSASDISMDLMTHKAKVDLLIRSPIHVTPLNLLGIPSQVTSTLLAHLPLPIADFLAETALNLWYGDLTKYGIKRPGLGPISRIIKSSKVPSLIVVLSNVLKIKPSTSNLHWKKSKAKRYIFPTVQQQLMMY